MTRAYVLVALLVLAASAADLHSAELPLDAPEYPRDPAVVFTAADSYEHALAVWKTVEDINAWIAANFSYDMARAMRLSETQRARSDRLSIHTPSDFFDTKAGVCVDLSRFAVETLRRIDPQSDPKYLMIEFAPMHISGNVLRLHWLASFTRDGRTYVFADSKRPGHIAGPYDNARQFIDGYARYRGRSIMAYRELASYQKQRRAQAVKLPAAAQR
jgi:hypothetical protein